MSLQDQLDAITARTRTLVQADRLAISERATAALFHSGIETRILPVGARAPEFTLQDAATGKQVRSTDLLALGPLILNFFRGRWCPYCVTELEAWRDLYPRIRQRGAMIAAISPQNRRHNDFTVQQHALPFPLLSDPGAALAAQFGIAWNVAIRDRAYFRSIMVNIPHANSGASYDNASEAAWNLPLPGVFLIRQDGTIAFAEAHADFRVRPDPSELLELI